MAKTYLQHVKEMHTNGHLKSGMLIFLWIKKYYSISLILVGINRNHTNKEMFVRNKAAKVQDLGHNAIDSGFSVRKAILTKAVNENDQYQEVNPIFQQERSPCTVSFQ